MTDIIAAVKALGVADADIQTTNLSLYPQYGSGSAPKVVGYQISEQIEVTVRDLDKAGDVVDAATAEGATNVNGISFELADPVKARTTRAPQPSSPPGRAPRRWRAPATCRSAPSSRSPTRPSPRRSTTATAGSREPPPIPDVATPVQPGTQDLSATVTVVFEIS